MSLSVRIYQNYKHPMYDVKITDFAKIVDLQ